MRYNFKIAICDDSEIDRMTFRTKLQHHLRQHDYQIEIDEFSSGNELLAVESCDIDAIRFFLKLISEEKLYQSRDVYSENRAEVEEILFRSMRSEHTISKKNVLWIEAQGKKSVIHTANEAIETTNALAEYRELLDSGEFIRPIRYAIVRKGAISRQQGNVLILTDGTQIPVSRTYRKEIEKAFQKE